jgi:hypothetical protein
MISDTEAYGVLSGLARKNIPGSVHGWPLSHHCFKFAAELNLSFGLLNRRFKGRRADPPTNVLQELL